MFGTVVVASYQRMSDVVSFARFLEKFGVLPQTLTCRRQSPEASYWPSSMTAQKFMHE